MDKTPPCPDSIAAEIRVYPDKPGHARVAMHIVVTITLAIVSIALLALYAISGEKFTGVLLGLSSTLLSFQTGFYAYLSLRLLDALRAFEKRKAK